MTHMHEPTPTISANQMAFRDRPTERRVQRVWHRISESFLTRGVPFSAYVLSYGGT